MIHTIFKKGNPQDPGNYRGISLIPAIAKTYDKILTQRLILWYRPHPSQAGAQKNRGWVEQVMTIRLLMGHACEKKKQLYIAFVDFQKACDCIDRQALLHRLAEKGCGSRFLNAMTSQLTNTTIRIGKINGTITKGVKQGAPSSCTLFIMLMDTIAEEMDKLPHDDWLQSCHCLFFSWTTPR